MNSDRISSTELVTYTDNVVVGSTGHTSFILETVTKSALDKVSGWMNGSEPNAVGRENGSNNRNKKKGL
ncbi:Reverse transcriptase domain-containing protein [Aphis craccivora]|uniref:Reverse transcriptase domain-containing protein n=1 Tax=Aphis craccivora TaxID=307492 RepID=A0A6G0ZJ60_APHCR|nr:Reverse transcriptase domain-containing protein [Aphis craccivora]